MEVGMHRNTATGERSVQLLANDTARTGATLHQWINMLLLAERWLCERQQQTQATKQQQTQVTKQRPARRKK